MEQEIIEIGERIVHREKPLLEGVIRGIQCPIPGCEPKYFVKWKFCRSVSGPISALMIEKKRPDAVEASGLGGVKAA